MICSQYQKGVSVMYIISVKRIADRLGNQLSEEQQYFEYAAYDDECSPDFFENKVEYFSTVKSAKEWWKIFKLFFDGDFGKEYDVSTLSIRKCIYEDVEKLSL